MKSIKLKSTVAMLCTLVMVTSMLAGCGPKKVEPVVEKDKVNNHLVISMSVIGADIAGLTKEGKPDANLVWLQKKFDFEFKFVPLTWDNYIDQTRLWLASGEAPDLMMLDVAPTRYPEYLTWVKQGLIKPYPEFGTKYPNLQKRFDGLTGGQNFKVDGKLYGWPAYVDLIKYNYTEVDAILYRKDWATKLNLVKPNDEYTWDEWTNLIKTVVEKDPNGNGPGKTIGLLGVDWAFPKYFGPGAVSPNMGAYTKDSSGKYVWGPSLPESLEAVKLTKQMYDQGLIWKDQMMVKNDDLANKFNAGLAFAAIGGAAGVVSSTAKTGEDVKKVDPSFDPAKDLGLAIVHGPDGKVLGREGSDQWSQEAMNGKISEEKATRWTEILDYLVSDEGYNFRTLGIPDVDWKMVDNKPVANWPVDAKTGLATDQHSNGTWPWLRAAGCNDGFALTSPAQPQWAKDMVTKGYERFTQSDIKRVPLDQKLAYFSAPTYDKVGNMEKEIYQEIAKLMTSKNVESDWNTWVKDQMPKIQPVLDEINAKLK